MKTRYRKGRQIRTFAHLIREQEKQGTVIYVPRKGNFFHTFYAKKMVKRLIMLVMDGAFYEARLRKR